MTEPYEAREIQEGDWVMQHGEPYVYYGEKLLATGELVTWFKDIIEEWAERVRLECETTQGFHTLQTEVARLTSQEETYLDMVKDGQEELAKVEAKLSVAVNKSQLDMMRHALGWELGQEGSRNYYCSGEGCDGLDDLEALTMKGLMVQRDDPVSDGIVFQVTNEGRKFLGAASS